MVIGHPPHIRNITQNSFVVFVNCRSDFEDLDKIKDIKFKTATWGKVYESRRKDGKLSSSCMTDYNGPIENVFEQCRLRRSKVNRNEKMDSHHRILNLLQCIKI